MGGEVSAFYDYAWWESCCGGWTGEDGDVEVGLSQQEGCYGRAYCSACLCESFVLV